MQQAAQHDTSTINTYIHYLIFYVMFSVQEKTKNSKRKIGGPTHFVRHTVRARSYAVLEVEAAAEEKVRAEVESKVKVESEVEVKSKAERDRI